MKIKSVKVYRKNLFLKKPYTIAYETISSGENIFLEINLENGMYGIGAANPSFEVVGETPEQTFQNLNSDFFQKFAGKNICLFNQLIDETKNQFPNLPGTQAAVDIALHDAFCKFLNISVVDFYGRKINSLPTSVTIGIKNVEETLLDAESYAQKGFQVIKVKIGLNVEEDIERIIKLREKFSNRLKIRVDANQGYNFKKLKFFLDKTKHANIELIEQPLKAGNEKELLKFDFETRKYFTADESLKNAETALQFTAEKFFGIYNIKLMKCGGIKSALEIASIAKHADIELFWGCNDESIVSISAALHAAFACANTKYIDLDGSFDLAEDIVKGGFILEDGYMHPNGLPGLGVNKM
ncbi:MAG: dipeptide epimerase [Chitinophagaceae bacterium]